MSAYRLYTGGPYKQRSGSAITSSSTDINGGAAKNVGNSENLTRSDFHKGNYIAQSVAGGTFGVSAADFTLTFANDATFTEHTNSLIKVTCNAAHGVSVDTLIRISADTAWTDAEIVRVVEVISTTVFIINRTYTSAFATVSNITVYNHKGTFATQAPDNFIMKKNDATVHGQAETKLASGAADVGSRDKVHKINALRTYKVATAIRTGTYNIFRGTFSSTPSSANDFASMDVDGTNVPDDEAKNMVGGYNVGGEITYRTGGRTAATTEYERKST